MDWSKELGARVRNLRRERGMNQVALARECGVDQSVISDIENGADMKVKTLRGLCRALQVSPTVLLEGSETPDALMVRLMSFEGQLVGLFRQLSPDLQHDVLVALNNKVNESTASGTSSAMRPFASAPPAIPAKSRR